MPEGDTPETIAEMQKELKELCKSGSSDRDKIRQLMESTFPQRRRDVLTLNVKVLDLVKQYPPLEERKGTEASA
jgi:hypothetical protein